MTDFFAGLFGPEMAGTAMIIASLVALLLVLFLIWLVVRAIRRPRAAGGRRSKQARLAVTDAAAIDPRRRLVLVRRDDVEHLIMIGGPTDVVIEQDIRRLSSARSIQDVEPKETVATTKAIPPLSTPSPAASTSQAHTTPPPSATAAPSISSSQKGILGAAAGGLAATSAKAVAASKEAARDAIAHETDLAASSKEESIEKITATVAAKNSETAAPVPEPKVTEPAPTPEVSVTPQPSAEPKPKSSQQLSTSDDIEALLDQIAAPKR
ncbi:hypothetical protein ACFQ14_14090 [Pseudahrensia aquimaris]|uniref:Flagellar biosynthesis protein FliO n=1 Tax=Pseudahrensia aquimaris TaxID=744461 RepID=A0ABW3FGB7_9HYPH